ncbi:MAG: hypothetical protein ACI85I_002685 [Arenicella sp.]|jgi:hypothetical protein
MRLFITILCVFALSSCSIINACFNSNLATAGRKYNSYGKGKSGGKASSHKKVKGNKLKPGEYDNENLPGYAKNMARPSKTYTKEQLKAIKKQNKYFYKMNKGGKGKFRYPYQITSPYVKEAEALEKKAKEAKQESAKKEKKKE